MSTRMYKRQLSPQRIGLSKRNVILSPKAKSVEPEAGSTEIILGDVSNRANSKSLKEKVIPSLIAHETRTRNKTNNYMIKPNKYKNNNLPLNSLS